MIFLSPNLRKHMQILRKINLSSSKCITALYLILKDGM